MHQVIANLLANAAKFGEGKPIEVRVEGDAERARLIVADQGCGIALADQERIFGQFERAAAAGAASGLGLGLYIARKIVEAHGGRILVRSSVGAGSTFTVELPRKALSA
jgi:signal transduction histidine kinase